MSAKPIKAFKHKHATRAAIPSHEEAGAEAASPKVAKGPTTASFPKNPVVHRGQDPELFWLQKYGADDLADKLPVDIRSLYRHEHIQPEMLLPSLMRVVQTDADQGDLFGSGDFFSQAFGKTDELTKPGEYYYKHREWTNRLIQGDSLLVMASLLEREGMAGAVQCIYLDPPYGIKYGSNWQIRLNNRTVTDGADDSLSGEPEQIKAFRDTWELGIHSYLSYLRDRLLVAKDLLHASGSCFVQISDENVHLVRCLMDEVFGSENFVSLISFKKTGYQASGLLPSNFDYIIWYAKDFDSVKYRQLHVPKLDGLGFVGQDLWLEEKDGKRRRLTREEHETLEVTALKFRVFRHKLAEGAGDSGNTEPFTFEGREFRPKAGKHWSTHPSGMKRLLDAKRFIVMGNSLRYVNYLDDFAVTPITANWTDTVVSGFSDPAMYVVQTSAKVIQRCLLMCTDPGDLVLDPTCGSGTTAYVAEQWGRRWITIDTSRIALNLAKQRLMTARFPYYKLYDQETCDLRQGFVYTKIPHVMLRDIANGEPPTEETLYDQPDEDKKRLRIAGRSPSRRSRTSNPSRPPHSPPRARATPRWANSRMSFSNTSKAPA